MRRTLFIVGVSIILIAAASIVPAQQKYGVNKTITFKPGVRSMRILGTLRSGLEVHDYRFSVKAGHKMQIDLVSNDKNIGFYIMTIPDGYVMTDDVGVRRFDNDLPYTGEYKLVVETDSKRGAKYALEITIDQSAK
jgi:hypothetical protein